jgi:hypothetical protein
MKQTAVEWLAEKYDYVYWMVKRDEISPGLAEEWKKHYLEQAKEMEKEQIKSAFTQGDLFAEDYFNPEKSNIDCSENYYNETFKSE